MLASLLRPKPRRTQIDESPFASPFTPSDHNTSPWFRAAANRGRRRDYDAPELHDVDEESLDEDEDEDADWIQDHNEEEDERPMESTPLLPIFSASQLGMFFFPPVFLNLNFALKDLQKLTTNCRDRFPPSLRYHPCDSSLDRLPL